MACQKDNFSIDTTIILTTSHPLQCLLFWKPMIGIVTEPKHMMKIKLYIFFLLENLQQTY